ncbi:MAG: hypothetical protein K0Q56_2537 [Sporolactobacillus laevolacticus]|jgi:hypothetical protein|nr:hypothetical protein [Sporolactobacillus laevolacticus]
MDVTVKVRLKRVPITILKMKIITRYIFTNQSEEKIAQFIQEEISKNLLKYCHVVVE